MTAIQWKSVVAWLRAKMMEVFAADLRSLALFRIVLALLALADLVVRATDIRAHYTDQGVLPRDFLLQEMARPGSFSIHLMSGDSFVQAALLLAAGLAALALLVGWRTRLMTVVVWVLLISIHGRNPIILNSGDVLLRVLYFWAMFLPLGACWSVDRILDASPPPGSMRFFSVATLGLWAQIAFVYVFTALLKSGREWRVDGTAIYYALSIDQFTTPLGAMLYQFPMLLWAMTFGVLWFEVIGPVLLFSPIFTGPVRMAAVLGVVALHLGIGLTMSIGAFPWISSLAMVCFLPPWFWDKVTGRAWRGSSFFRAARAWQERVAGLIRGHLAPRAARWSPVLAAPHGRSVEVAANTGGLPNAGSEGVVPTWSAAPRTGMRVKAAHHHTSDAGREPAAPLTPPPIGLRSSVWTNLVAAGFIALIFWWNLATVSDFRFPQRLNPIASFLRLDQYWAMFAPFPLKDDGWYVIPGTLRSGAQVELFPVTRGDFTIRNVSWEKPPFVYATYKNDRWRKYMMNLWMKEHQAHRLYLGRYICREWNARHRGPETLETFEMYYMLEVTQPDYQTVQPEKVLIWTHRCFG